jgi:hypothetical protein
MSNFEAVFWWLLTILLGSVIVSAITSLDLGNLTQHLGGISLVAGFVSLPFMIVLFIVNHYAIKAGIDHESYKSRMIKTQLIIGGISAFLSFGFSLIYMAISIGIWWLRINNNLSESG